MPKPSPTALIAEDEPLLAAALKAELAQAWPGLQVVATVGDGLSALQKTLELLPEILFFDIQMPGMSGLDAALALVDEWPTETRRFPALVFVTAYDQYAVQAFEAQAVDYVLKPVNQLRLQKTVSRLMLALENKSDYAIEFDNFLYKLRSLSSAQLKINGKFLNALQVSVGSSIRMVPIDDVACFEAADKYVRVLTASAGKAHEYLIRTPLKELLPQLDPALFWQVHRGTVVRAVNIELVTRDEAGKMWLQLRGLGGKFAVSRLYAHLFKAM